MDDGKTVYISSPRVDSDLGIDISGFCRAASITIVVDDVNRATLGGAWASR
jgi:hypothetical protein